MMTETPNETYNGWKNYPTWAVNLWLSNDEGLYAGAMDLTQACFEEWGDRELDGHKLVQLDLADSLKEWVCDDLAPDLGASFAADLLGYALDQVDWNEIADAWIEQVNEQ